MGPLRRLYLLLGLILGLLLVSGSGEAAQAAPGPYEIYAIRYATLKNFPLSGLLPNVDPAARMDIAMTVWLVRGNGHVILVDSGFYRDKYLNQYQYDGYVKPSDALAPLGIKPEDVTDLVITHMHWDHADGIDLFPKARIWIQKEELEYYAGEAWQTRRTHGGIDPDDIQDLVKFNVQGRVGMINGDAQEFLPGVTAYTGGKHTYASQYVGVATAAGIVVLASDNVYLYTNLEKHVPISETLDAASNLRAQDRMKQLATSGIIIPGHDPAVFTKFPNPFPNIAKIE